MQRWAIGAGVAVILAAAGLAALPYLVSKQEIRAAVTRALVATTGVTPHLGNEVRLVMLPRPTVRLDELSLDEGARPGFSAGSMQATVRLLPLLAGTIEIGSITFEHPRLAIEIRGDRAFVRGLPLSPPSEKDRAELPEIRIVDGTLELHLESAGRTETLSTLDAALAWSGNGLTATGSFQWRAVTTAGSLTIADTGALGRGGRSPLRLRLDGGALRVGFDGGIAFRNGLQAEGVLAADGPSFRQALAWLAIEPPTRGGLGAFSLKAQAALTPATLSLSGLIVELDGNRAEGGLTFKREGGRSILQGTLASDNADFTRYAGAARGEAEVRELLRTPIDVKTLGALDLDMRLSARKAVFGGIVLERVALAAQLKSGELALSLGEAQLFGGTLRGSAALAPAGDKAAIKVEANLNAFDVERGLAETTGLRPLDGKGTLDVALEGTGDSVQAVLRDLSGETRVSVERGSIVGINVGDVLRRFDRRPLGSFDLRGGRTPFDRLAARLKITKGSVSLEEARIESPQVRVTLSGAVSIARRDLDLHGTASLARAGTNFDLPFMVVGSWQDPSVIPDAEALILRSGAAAPLFEGARGKNATGAVRSVIDSLTGKKPAAPEQPGEQPATPRPTP
jgi:AsmA protein